MNRPWVIWLTALSCAVVVLGAIGMLTHMTLKLERQNFVESERSERVGKAMLLMDSYVESLLSRENSRPAEEFAPLKTVINKSSVDGSVNFVNELSPLVLDLPKSVNYYWFTDTANRFPVSNISSPQFPNNEALQTVRSLQPSGVELKDNQGRHNELLNLLNTSSTWAVNDQSVDSLKFNSSNLGKASYLANCARVHGDNPVAVDQSDLNRKLAQAVQTKGKKWLDAKEAKQVLQQQRSLEKLALQRAKVSRRKTKSIGNTKVVAKQTDSSWATSIKSGYNFGYSNGNAIENPDIGKFSGAEVSPFVATWLEDELMLVRSVSTNTQDFIQGVWLNKDSIAEELLAQANPYLPNATLVEAKDKLDKETLTYGQSDVTVMSRMPWRIEPGSIDVQLPQLSAMRLNLIIAWAGVVCAVVAVFFMFRGVMKLSERRASFVSSVSHELRTPLTTFKLYTEMLADGMVKDEDKKQQYLETLNHESDRLSHMVENVLSFSQLEKGRAQRKLSSVVLQDILRPLESGFRLRLRDESMDYSNEVADSLMNLEVKVDVTSVDQILTNLVDNAAKYGQNDSGDSVVRISCERVGRYLRLRVADDGKGVLERERSRLFKPFHKSDVEAAHSKPGVGLGLALCRKLARASGGDLVIIDPPEPSIGACFELRLPIA